MNARIMRIAAAEDGRPRGAVLGIATLLALLSASCCVLPIGLAIVGLGGAWLAVLGPFVAYRWAILGAVGLVLLWAWFRLFMGVRRGAQMRGATVLATVASLSFAAALAAPLWEAEATRMLMGVWSAAR